MRTDLELWLIVEENFEEYFERGLCLTISKMYEMFIITKNELNRLLEIINEYAKNKFGGDPNYDIRYSYLWKQKEAKPRRLFIQKQILKLIRDEKLQ